MGLWHQLLDKTDSYNNGARGFIRLLLAGGEDVPLRLALTEPPDVPGSVRLERDQDRVVQGDNATRACFCFRFAHRERLLMHEIDLLPPEFAQFLVAQSAIQIHYEGGVHVLAAQLRSFCEHASFLVRGVGSARRWRGREFHRLLAAQPRTD